MKKIIFTLLIIVGFFSISGYFYFAPYNDGIVRVGSDFFMVEVVDTPDAWRQGLSGRQEMCARCGMLFNFDEPREATFWMKDMQFDIDILWIRDGTIVHIAEGVSHTTPEKTYGPQQSVEAVVELPAGSAQKYSFVVGTTLDF